MNQTATAPASNFEVLRGTPHSGHVWVISKEVGKDNWQEVTRIPIIKGNEDPEASIMQSGDPGHYRLDLLSPEGKNLNRTFFKIDDKKPKDKPADKEQESPIKTLQRSLSEAINEQKEAIMVQHLAKTWKESTTQSDEINSLQKEKHQILETHQSEKQQMLDTIKELSEKLSNYQQQVGSATVKTLEQQLQEERRKNDILMLEERRKLEKMSGESNTSTFQMFQLMNNQQQLYMQQQQQFFQLLLTQSQRDKEESLKLYATIFKQQNNGDRSPSALETALPGLLTSVTDLMSSSVKKILEEQEGNDVFTSRISKVQNCITSLAPVVCTNIIKLVAALKGNNGQPMVTEALTQDTNVNQLLGNLQNLGIGPNEIKQIVAALPMLQGQSPAAAPVQNPPETTNRPATPKAPPIPAAPLIIDVPAFEIQEPDLAPPVVIATTTTAQTKE